MRLEAGSRSTKHVLNVFGPRSTKHGVKPYRPSSKARMISKPILRCSDRGAVCDEKEWSQLCGPLPRERSRLSRSVTKEIFPTGVL